MERVHYENWSLIQPQQLMSVFKEWNSTFVVFAEALEFAKIHRIQGGHVHC